MKALSVQIHPELTSDVMSEQVVSLLERLALDTTLVDRIQVARGTDDGNYVNVNFETSNLQGLWEAIRAVLNLMPGATQPRAPVIVVCEGDHGWSDYRLLYHFGDGLIVERIGNDKGPSDRGPGSI